MNHLLVFCSILAIILQLWGCRHAPRAGSHPDRPTLTFAEEAKLAQEILPPVLDSTTALLVAPDTSINAVAILEATDQTRGKRFFALNWKHKTIAALGFLTASEIKSSTRIQASEHGVIVFARAVSDREEDLFIRTVDSTHQVKAPFRDYWITGGSDRFPSFELSPDGKRIVTCAFSDFYSILKTGDTMFTNILISSMHIGESEFGPPRIDTIATLGTDNVNVYERILVGWEHNRPNSVLLQDLRPGDLYSTTSRLWSYNVETRSYDLRSNRKAIYLCSSLDGRYIVWTNNDESCCAGVNYTDNLLILEDMQAGSSSVIYDEWARYHNRGKPEEHSPQRAQLSPNGRHLAVTIRHFYEPGGRSLGTEPTDDANGEVSANFQVLVLGTHDSLVDTLSEREMMGWLDDKHLLVEERTEDFDGTRWNVEYGALYVFDIEASEEYPFLTSGPGVSASTKVRCLDILFRSTKIK